MPEICTRVMDEGASAGKKLDMDLMLKDYYKYRGWDIQTGKPKKDKLIELELDHVAADMY